ncbi:MAG: hypothetical protein GXO49_03855 [Chlorobi bacterium]|nr:hypothetical protein [Chlorobiota bacterium]
MSDNEKYCPKHETCPLFQGEMLASKKAQKIYMRLYCTAGEKGRNRCRRFQLVQKGYTPAEDIMPNDDRSVEAIIRDL